MPLKKRRMKKAKEDPNLVALEETSCLVANGRFQCLVALGMFHVWWSMGTNPFHLFLFFPPINFTSIFLVIDFKVVLYHGFKPLLYIFPSFSLTYKL
jgi:hypothetical protein